MSKIVKSYSAFEWIDLEKPSNKELKDITEPFNIDFNILEDSLEHGHLPKLENVSGYTFIILRAYSANDAEIVTTVGELSNKIAFFINHDRLITIHRAPFDFLKNKSNDYDNSERLMLDIIKEMLFTYDKPLQLQGDKMDEFEGEIFLRSDKSISIEALYYQKAKARISRKLLQLTQNVLNQIMVQPEHNSLLQDLKETTVRYLLNYDEVIDDANTILNTHLSLTAKKSNDVMKLLTVFSAFFLPLTFIVGVYGMNFENIPELKMHFGYFITLAGMLLISIVIYIWFKRKKIM